SDEGEPDDVASAVEPAGARDREVVEAVAVDVVNAEDAAAACRTAHREIVARVRRGADGLQCRAEPDDALWTRASGEQRTHREGRQLDGAVTADGEGRGVRVTNGPTLHAQRRQRV